MTASPDLIPISRIANRYFLYDLEHVKQCREQHGMLGVFVGTLPQYSQQNIFLGLPQALMAEEARLLVEMGVAYIVDEVEAHTHQLRNLKLEDRQLFQRALHRHGLDLAKEDSKRAEQGTKRALERMPPAQRALVEAKLAEKRRAQAEGSRSSTPSVEPSTDATDDDESLFSSPPPRSESRASSVSTVGGQPALRARLITPTTSYPPLSLYPPSKMQQNPDMQHNSSSSEHADPQFSHSTQSAARDSTSLLPPVPSLPAYALYKHLHSLSYFQSPGVRFGCQFCVYPGDPLRFHSHFLARGYAWEQEIDLIGIVGGGRLGTGVKKSFLIGGPAAKKDNGNDEEEVRTFCIEWAGM